MSFLNRLKDIIGLNDQDEYKNEYDYDYDHVDIDFCTPASHISSASTDLNEEPKNKNSHVVGLPEMSHGTSEMVLIEPRAFEEMPQVIDALRQKKSVILNMTLICQEEAQRAVDFVAGGTHAIDGHYECIGDNIFLFTPNCVQVSTPNNVLTEVITAPVRSGRSVNPGNSWVREPIAK